MRQAILLEAIPKTLTDLLGLETILRRVPEVKKIARIFPFFFPTRHKHPLQVYMRSVFACYLASRYVYTMGAIANEFGFFEFMQPFFAKLRLENKEVGIKLLTLEAEREGEKAAVEDEEVVHLEQTENNVRPPAASNVPPKVEEVKKTEAKAKKAKRSSK